jgi:hypothetical protein
MESTELLTICISAFVAVFFLLSVLAVVMYLILVLFPHRTRGTDAAAVAAITSTLASIYPGTKITRIEEIK